MSGVFDDDTEAMRKMEARGGGGEAVVLGGSTFRMTIPDHIAWNARRQVIRAAVRTLLTAIGENPDRPGLKETPDRVARFWEEFASYDDDRLDTTFEESVTDDLIAVKGIEVWSLCEHHLLPFKATIAIGYVSSERILGLSKFARIAQRAAHTLQVQERLTADVARDVQSATNCVDVAVIIRGEHTCVSMRGIRSPAVMHTSMMLGRFRESGPLRAEFLALVGDAS